MVKIGRYFRAEKKKTEFLLPLTCIHENKPDSTCVKALCVRASRLS